MTEQQKDPDMVDSLWSSGIGIASVSVDLQSRQVMFDVTAPISTVMLVREVLEAALVEWEVSDHLYLPSEDRPLMEPTPSQDLAVHPVFGEDALKAQGQVAGAFALVYGACAQAMTALYEAGIDSEIFQMLQPIFRLVTARLIVLDQDALTRAFEVLIPKDSIGGEPGEVVKVLMLLRSALAS